MTAPNVPIGVGTIAAALGWNPRRARRWLDGLAERDPSIVVRVRGRRMTTLATLRRVCPDVAKRFASDKDVDALQAGHEELAEEIRAVAGAHGQFSKKAQELIEDIQRRLRTLEATVSDQKRTRRGGS
jgi:ABC-type Fe3+-hydroxamate transport system substrate-binding protein